MEEEFARVRDELAVLAEQRVSLQAYHQQLLADQVGAGSAQGRVHGARAGRGWGRAAYSIREPGAVLCAGCRGCKC